MAKIRDIIARVDDIKPNAFKGETKLAWIGELDGRIAADVMLMDITEVKQLQYSHPDDLESETLVDYPHDTIYDLWLSAKIDFANGEYTKYQNTMEMFNAYYEDFVNWFIRSYAPGQGYCCNGEKSLSYYITAYGLAIKQGFVGTLDEWLASLHGEKGDTGAKGDTGDSGVYIGETEPTDPNVRVWINPAGSTIPVYKGEVV